MKAVVLAGGRGQRLRPYTTNFPKPLLPVGDRPVLELIICQLAASGIEDIILATGHLSEMIQAYFKDGQRFGVRIRYSREDKPLGTAGPLALLKGSLHETFLVLCGDVLCDIDLRRLLRTHQETGSVATVAVAHRASRLDFGLVELDGRRRFRAWTEKPRLSWTVSMGIYVLEPAALRCLRRGPVTMPELIVALRDRGLPVMGYVHRGFWLDIGRREDYETACRKFQRELRP